MKIPLPPPSKAPAILIALALQASAIAPQAQPNQRSAGVTAETRVNTWLKTQDPNKDGRIAPDEATGLMKRFFERNDANSDGFLDKSELKALAGRLGRPRSNQPKANRNSQAQGGLSTEQMLKNAPKDVVIEPDIAYRPGDSKSWRLDLVRPRGQGGPLRPAIVFVHGGGWRNGDKRARTFLEGAIRYAQKGYVCVTVNYRLTGEAPFPACIEDVKCAVRWLRAHAEKYNLDPERMGGYGNSAGAHLVAILGLVKPDAGLEGDGPYQDQSSLLQAVCASATPTDFNLFPRPRATDPKFANDKYDGAKLATLSSPLTHVRKDAPPFLLIHGTADRTVNVKHSDTFAEALKKAGATDLTYLRIEGEGHGVFNLKAAETGPAMAAFFARTIGAPK